MKKRDFLKAGLLGMGVIALPEKAWALEYYPTPSDKKWAVLYGTWCGSARDAGVWISEGMDGIANVYDARENPDLSGYDHVVIGGAIRGGKVPNELQAYIDKNKSILKGKIRGLFVVCGNRMQTPGPEQKVTMIDNYLARLCDVTNVPSKVLLGRITFGLMDESSRKMMQSMNMPEYDNLKRPECMEFGKEILKATV
jgi:menaquinone-dependent protoporphyrinogen IX oxidase